MYEAVTNGRPDRVPCDIGFTPAVLEMFKQKTGMDDPAKFFGCEGRWADIAPMEKRPDFSKFLAQMPEGARINSDYGTAEVPGEFYHFARYVFPMADMTTLEELEEYPWPDYHSEYRYAHVEDKIKSLHDEGWFVQGWSGHIFETAWQLTVYEKFMECMVMQPEFIAAILDRITENNAIKAKRLTEGGADMLLIADDVAMQDRMMMSPATWREWFKPRHGKVVKAARDINPNIPVWYHSDGQVEPIIEDLIDIGVTVLNPVQPECLDVREIKRKYGGRMAFWGTIGTQTVLPFGTPEDVKRTVKEMIEVFAPGLVLAPTHVVEPDVPWENLVALRDAIRDYGKLG
jgi:uroporphyrinogen decarboxylase